MRFFLYTTWGKAPALGFEYEVGGEGGQAVSEAVSCLPSTSTPCLSPLQPLPCPHLFSAALGFLSSIPLPPLPLSTPLSLLPPCLHPHPRATIMLLVLPSQARAMICGPGWRGPRSSCNRVRVRSMAGGKENRRSCERMEEKRGQGSRGCRWRGQVVKGQGEGAK